MVAYTSIQHGNKSASRRRMHWHVPATIFAALLLGLLVAICHHCIYQALSGKVVSSDTQQRWIIRGGTALAFLFTMFLTVATGSAYIQQLWLSLSKRPIKIAQLDDMFEVLKDATGFIDIMLWLRNPLLALLAVVTWAIPISAVITPGTLTVQLRAHTASQDLRVPTLNMEGEAFYSMIDDMAGVAGGPNSDVTRVATSAATLGSVLPMLPAHANSSYQLHFIGPALQCTPWNHTAVVRFQQQSCKYFRANFCPGEYDSSKQALRYMSWTNDYPDGPYDYDFYNETKPPFAPVSNTSNPYPFDDTSYDLYVYVAQASYEGTGMLEDPSPTSLGPDLLVTCAFRNASYTIDFSFQESRQTMKMTRHEFLDFYDFSDYGNMDDGAPPEYSYNAMWDAFSALIIGYMAYLAAADGGEPTNTQGTQITNTLLDPLKRSWPNADAFGADMETMFNNVTMSYFSNPSLTTNASTSPMASTTYSVARNVYSYDASELWKAYGSGIGVACLCVLIGFRAMLLNGATFENSWSSIFRSTQATNFSSLFRDGSTDQDGAEPAPTAIKHASVIYTREGFRLHEHSTIDERPASDKDSAVDGSGQPSLQSGSGEHNPHLNRQVSDAQSWAKRASTRIQNIDGQDPGVDLASSVSERGHQAAIQQPQHTVRRKPTSSSSAEMIQVPDD